MSDYREELNHRKAVRSGIVDQRPTSQRLGKRKKPIAEWVVEYKWVGHMSKLIASLHGEECQWKKHRCYKTKEIAELVISTQTRKHEGSMEYRLKEQTP